MEVRNTLKDDYRTQRQWGNAGHLPNTDVPGTKMYTNGNRQSKAPYFTLSKCYCGKK